MNHDAAPPPAVERLLEEHIASVGTLELLLLLHAGDGRAHRIDEICTELGSPRSWTELQLDALAQARLVAGSPDAGWSYAPGSPRQGAAVEDLARAWRRNREVVSRWVFKPPRRRRGRRGSR